MSPRQYKSPDGMHPTGGPCGFGFTMQHGGANTRWSLQDGVHTLPEGRRHAKGRPADIEGVEDCSNEATHNAQNGKNEVPQTCRKT